MNERETSRQDSGLRPGTVAAAARGPPPLNPATAADSVPRMAWLLLVLAGLFEVVWAIGLRYTQGWTRPWPSLLTLLALAASMVLLERAQRELPIGTAYAVWVGIGALGAAVLGMVLFAEPRSALRLLFLGLLLVSIVGLKLSA